MVAEVAVTDVDTQVAYLEASLDDQGVTKVKDYYGNVWLRDDLRSYWKPEHGGLKRSFKYVLEKVGPLTPYVTTEGEPIEMPSPPPTEPDLYETVTSVGQLDVLPPLTIITSGAGFVYQKHVRQFAGPDYWAAVADRDAKVSPSTLVSWDCVVTWKPMTRDDQVKVINTSDIPIYPAIP